MPETSPQNYDALGEAKRLLRSIRAATLATLTAEGAPFASLAAIATTADGSPILLLSRLAAHRRHLEADGRCSILLAEGGKGDPLAHPRLTLVGRASAAPDAEAPTLRRRFLARNPKSELYVDFPDFGFWTVTIVEAHLNGGFARAASFPGAAVLTDLADSASLTAAEEGAITHMNADHREAIALYATRLARLPEGDWRLSGCDPDGLDLVCGDRTGRLAFPARVTTPGELRTTLVALAAQARQQGA